MAEKRTPAAESHLWKPDAATQLYEDPGPEVGYAATDTI
jgi:hypothetical protein